MSLIPQARPVLSMLHSPGCSACAAAKPEFTALAERLRGQIDCQLVNVDQVQVAVPVTLIPGFHFAVRNKNYYIDPQEMMNKYSLKCDAAGLFKWVELCVADYRRST